MEKNKETIKVCSFGIRLMHRNFPEFASISTKNGLKLRLDMKDNGKCITISLPTSTWSHRFVDIEAS